MYKTDDNQFGCLTSRKNNKYDSIIDKKNGSESLNMLFKNYKKQFRPIDVLLSDNDIAIAKLSKLIVNLQTKSLRYKTKSKSDKFVL